MSYLYDSMNRRRPTRPGATTPGGQPLPTLDDYAQLAQAYRALQVKVEAQAEENSAKTAELAIKSEALQRQSEDLKRTQAELMWTKAALQQMQRELDDLGGQGWQTRYEQLKAEVDDLRRRWEQRFYDETAEARRTIVRDMLPLADHLELALRHSATLEGEAAQRFVSNIESTLRAFLDTLRRNGAEPQNALGAAFDPALHEAVGHVVNPSYEPDHVAEVVQTGYVEGERVLRPARVLLSSGERTAQ